MPDATDFAHHLAQRPRAALLSRRGFVLGTATCAALPWRATAGVTSPGLPHDGTLSFAVSRNGSPIGQHDLVFSTAPGVLTVRIEVNFRVHFGFITLYRYHHQGVETWRDGQFESLLTQTNDNGTHVTAEARRTPGGVVVQATGRATQLLPAGARPLTHWAMLTPGAVLFNPQTGERIADPVRPEGKGSVALANGRVIPARGYALDGKLPIKDWYDVDNVWAALDGTGKDGSQITYRRV